MPKKPGFTAMFAGMTVFGIAAILAVTLIPSPAPRRSVSGIKTALSYTVSDHRLSSSEISDGTLEWRRLGDGSASESAQYAYVRLEIANEGADDRSLVIQNASRNYYTALMTRNGPNLSVRFRHGDPVPSGESPLRHIRAAFPVMIRSGGTETYVLEYMNDRTTVLDPEVFESSAWFSRAGFERDIVSLISASVLCLTILNLIAGLIMFRPELVRMSFLTFSILFFFLRQSRFLLILCDPLPYAEWLYPLSIGLELVSAHLFFGCLMGRNFLPWQHWGYRVLSLLTIALVGVSFFAAAYTVADILNVFAMITLVIVLVGVINAIRNRDENVLFTMLAFAPWISMMAVEIFIMYAKPREIFLADYRQAFGMLLTLMLVTIASVKNREREGMNRLRRLGAELEAAKRGTSEGRLSRDEAGPDGCEGTRARLASECETSLEGILAAAGTLRREYSDPGVAAATDMIISGASRIAETLGSRNAGMGGNP